MDEPEEHEPWINPRASARASKAGKSFEGGRPTPNKGSPATSEKIYTEAETEFMMAMDEHKSRTRKLFPTWSDVLGVLNRLGYHKDKTDK